ncbi:MAG: cytochrome c [Nevskiaceae bacterium]|jgi:mono/diheme cytochrome c family protein|nr:cytochrome c [Nevskiaceae bacterium]
MKHTTSLVALVLAGAASLLTACSSSPDERIVAPAGGATPAGMSQGEYLARAGNCVACHSIPGGAPFSGGLKMAVPNVGFIYTTNITPDPETGIGNYTFEEFDRVMRTGKARDGHRLYPAMPYPSYAKVSVGDMRALYDYFMKEVQPVKQANIPEETSGLLSARWMLGIWNMLFLDDDPYETEDDQSAEWNRGAYLVEGLGHCGACHTPRGFLSHEKGLEADDSNFLAGASLDNWSASSLNGDINSGLGRWSTEEVTEFLKTGKNLHGTAFGPMVEVINSSSAHLSDSDLNAMAVFLKSLPAKVEKGAKPWEYSDSTTTQLMSLKFEQRGSQPYFEYCVSCHGYDGRGSGAKLLPPLAGNPVVLDPRPDSLINLVLNGSLRIVAQGHVEVYDMPLFHKLMTDQQIADAVTFIRNGWGNTPDKAREVTPAQVAAIRAATKPVDSDDVVVLRMK